MKIVTRLEHIKDIINNPYLNQEQINKLKALGDEPKEEDVKTILTHWHYLTSLVCDECLQEQLVILRLDQDPDVYDTPRFDICQSCLLKGEALFRQEA